MKKENKAPWHEKEALANSFFEGILCMMVSTKEMLHK